MSTPTYQGDRNNEPQTNQEPSRDLMLINQPAGGVEFVNTKDDEMVTLYHKNGSLFRINKFSTDELATNDKRLHVQGDFRTEVNGNVVNIFDKNIESIQLGDSINKTGDIDKWQPYFEEYKKLSREVHNLKRLFEIKRVKVHNFIDQAPQQTKSGSLATCPVEATTSKMLYTVSPMIYTPAVKAPGSHPIGELIDPELEYIEVSGSGGKVSDESWGCFCCGGTGNSPSTQDGSWTTEAIKKTITQKRIDIQTKMFDLEKHLGQNKHREGGTKIDKIAKDYVGIIGLAFNDFESFRRDPKGKLVPHAVKVDPFGQRYYTSYRESSLIELVHVDPLPGGSYNLTVCNDYSLTVGSGGVNIKTTGPMELYAPVIATSAEEYILNSRGEVSIGAERFDVSAEIISLRPKKVKREIEDASGGTADLPYNGKTTTEPEQAVLVAGNLNVELNTVIAGGLTVGGELVVEHITAPMEEHITDGCFEFGTQVQCELDPTTDADCEEPPKSPVYADILEGCLIGYCIVADGDSAGTWPVYSTLAPNSVMVHQHHHTYKSLPMKLIRDSIDVEVTVGDKTETKTLDPHSAVRAIGARANGAVKVLPQKVINSITNNTVIEKLGGNICGETLVIDDCNWNETNKNDSRPEGEGVRTSNYEDSDIFERVKALEEKLESKYKELQAKLDSLSS